MKELQHTYDLQGVGQRTFLESLNFMKLGQAIEHENWQTASMTVQKMQKLSKEARIDTFERQLIHIKQCIGQRNKKQAKDILAVIIAKRTQMLAKDKMNSEIKKELQ